MSVPGQMKRMSRKAAISLCNEINRLILQGEDVRVLSFSDSSPSSSGSDKSRRLCGVSFSAGILVGFVQLSFEPISFDSDSPIAGYGKMLIKNRLIFVRKRLKGFSLQYTIEVIYDPFKRES